MRTPTFFFTFISNFVSQAECVYNEPQKVAIRNAYPRLSFTFLLIRPNNKKPADQLKICYGYDAFTCRVSNRTILGCKINYKHKKTRFYCTTVIYLSLVTIIFFR